MRRSTIIVCIAAVVVLSAGIAALMLWPEAEPEPGLPTPPPADTMDLIVDPHEDVSVILFSPVDGAPYYLRRDPESGDIELDAEDAIFQGFPSVMRAVFNTALSLANLNRVTEAADDEQLSMFGFDEPVMTWRVERIDGTADELLIGGMQVAGQGRYIRLQNSREVFLLNERQSTLLTHSLEELYDLSFFPMMLFPDVEHIVQLVDHILLETEKDVIELQKRTEEEIADSGFGSSLFQMLQPAVGECNDHIVQTIILENAAGIMPVSVEAARPADLSVYGLDEPARLTLSAGDWSGTLLIGDFDAERGGRFIMIDDYDAVLFDPHGDYSFLNVVPSQLRARLIWLHNIADVSSVTFELEGNTRVLRFEHIEEDEQTSLDGWLDGVEISETNARRLYVTALSITQDGETDEPVPDDPPVYRVTISFLEGGSESLELYQLNDSQFLIVHNGLNTEFFVTRMSLQQNMLGRFEMLDRGEDLPAS